MLRRQQKPPPRTYNLLKTEQKRKFITLVDSVVAVDAAVLQRVTVMMPFGNISCKSAKKLDGELQRGHILSR